MLSHYLHSIKELLSLVPVCHKFFKRIKAKNLLLNRKKCIKECFNEDKLKKKKKKKLPFQRISFPSLNVKHCTLFKTIVVYLVVFEIPTFDGLIFAARK